MWRASLHFGRATPKFSVFLEWKKRLDLTYMNGHALAAANRSRMIDAFPFFAALPGLGGFVG